MALFVIGLCSLLMLYATRLSDSIRNNIEIHVYLDKYVSGPEVDKIIQTVKARSFLQTEGPVSAVRFISKEEAAKDFIRDTGEDFTSFLGENPLRDALLIRIKPDFYNSRQMKLIKTDLEKIPGVFEAAYVENLAEEINRNIVKITLLLIGFASVLLVTIALLINNTIKLAMFSQRFLIRSMQLVGATSSFIQRPFLLRAALHGLAGGIIASVLLFVLLFYAESQVEGLSSLRNLPSLLILTGGLCLMGVFIGTFSAWRSIKKYLLISLDELY